MRCAKTVALFGIVIGSFTTVAAEASPEAVTPEEVLKLIHVPDGFTVELVAGNALVEHPVMACFDEQGRLFVAENAGQNLHAADLLKATPSSIRLLEDTHGSGVFDKGSTFADKMVFPQGVCWVDGSVYTSSPPSVWQLRDTRGTGTADFRKELVTSFGFTGNAADIHGPVLGPDGYLYWPDGRHGHHIVFPDGTVSDGLGARIFRCRPDGSGLEVVCGGGMDNPTKIAFTEEGEAFSGVNIIHGSPRRIDGIIYAEEGAVFPYYQRCIDEFKSTGPLFEPVDNLGWVAISGIVRHRGNALGQAYRDNLFSCQFNQHRIQRHIVERDGAGFKMTHEDFLTCSSPDFHPTDIIDDADGSLLVVNTGGWFRIGCPNSQIAKPDIKGCIFRVRRTDAPKVEDPRGLKLAWETLKPPELAALLNDARPFVRDRAIARLAKIGADAVTALSEALAKNSSAETRRNAVWALTRIDGDAARAAVRTALSDADASVRQVAASSAGLHRDAAAVSRLIERVHGDTAAIRRDAATALGRIGSHDAAPVLLASLHGITDRFLEHSLIYALIRIGDREVALKGMSDADPAVRRGALLVLDQIPNGGLTPDKVAPLLASTEPTVQWTAAQVISRHADWGGAMDGYFRQSLRKNDLSETQREELKQQIAAFGKAPVVQTLVSEELADPQISPAMRVLLLEAIAQSPVDRLPEVWQTTLARCIEDKDESIARQAVLTAGAGSGKFQEPLLRVARDAGRSAELRVEALTIAAPRLKQLEPELFDLLLTSLQPSKPALLRSAAANALSRAHLDLKQQDRLTDAVATAGPLELPGLLAAFEKGGDAEVGKKLVAALSRSAASGSLRAEIVTDTLKNYSDEVKQAAQPLLGRLAADLAQQKAHLDELAPILSTGNAHRGHDMFFGNKAACSTCHTIDNVGGHVGPDLSKIGAIRTQRDILEAIVYPSASFARGYEPFLIKTKDGDVLSGIITQQTADAIYLTTGPHEVKRVARAKIADLRQGTVSIMPQGLDTQLTRQELADLIAFVASGK